MYDTNMHDPEINLSRKYKKLHKKPMQSVLQNQPPRQCSCTSFMQPDQLVPDKSVCTRKRTRKEKATPVGMIMEASAP
jgi:hypothetical protein